MIIDSHCHAWTRRPYDPPVPDDEHRGRVEQLLNEMDLHGVDQAMIVCAQIDHNPENNAYIAEQVRQHPDRLHQVADVDCSWSETYHTPGAADRLKAAVEQWPIKGFTHYLRGEDDGWFDSDEGIAFFKVAEKEKLIASIAGAPHHQPALRRVAERFPTVPIVCHHLAGARATGDAPHQALKEILASAKLPNIYIKLSGFAYCSHVNWDYPYSDTHWIVRSLYEHFGPYRMCWGSDYPVVRFYMTYKQSLEAFRTHCTFVPEEDQAWILGKTLNQLLSNAREVSL
ncbi:MAG: amidohydrolase family protein [Chloroflexota bacterium]